MGWRSHLAAIWGPQEEPLWTDADRQAHRERKAFEARARIVDPKPRLAAVTSAPTRDAFDAWREHPVTQFVFFAYREQVATCERAWVGQSWEGGTADQRALDELRARADTYAALEETSYEGFCDAVGVEPERDDGETIAA